MDSFTIDFLDRVRKETGTEPGMNAYQRGPNEPEVIFRSPLELNREEEKKMCQWALRRFDDMQDERGEYEIDDPRPDQNNRFEYLETAWASKRELYDRMYYQDVAWRRMYGGIWDESNIH